MLRQLSPCSSQFIPAVTDFENGFFPLTPASGPPLFQSPVTSSDATPAAVIAKEPALSVLRYPHSPSLSCQVTQCFSTSFQYQPGISMPDSAHDQTPSRPYCELELSHGTS